MKSYKVTNQPRLIAPDDLIGAATVASMLGISRTQVVRRVGSGVLLPFAKLDSSRGAYVFDRTDIEALAKKQAA